MEFQGRGLRPRQALALKAIPSAWKTSRATPTRKLTDIPGIGADLAKKITETHRDRPIGLSPGATRESPRAACSTCCNLQTVGPQKVRLFYQQANIRSVDELEAAAKEGRLRGLAGNEREVRGEHPEGH